MWAKIMAFPVRKSLRIKNYDYSSDGYYFVKKKKKNKEKHFGEISASNQMCYSKNGLIAKKHICNIQRHYDNVRIDRYVIMPNHIHMIVVIGCSGINSGDDNPTLSNVVGLFKSGVTREIGFSVWQRLFHEHIIRNETSYMRISEYIENNPALWRKDRFYVW